MPRMQIPRKLQPLLDRPKRFNVLEGGRGSGKSITVGQIGLMKVQTEGCNVLCLRELQKSIKGSCHAQLKAQIASMNLSGFEVLDKSIKYNGEDCFQFEGMARNPDAVKSSYGNKYAWVEEAQSCSADSIQMLTPTIREAGSQLFFTMNRGSSADPMSKRFIEPFAGHLARDGIYEDKDHLIISVNYHDNPWFPPELEAERAWDEENLPAAVYNHVWLGEYLDEIEGSIIKAEWFDSCIDAHIKLGFEPKGAKFVSFDPSDRGDDAKGLSYRHGNVFLDVTEETKGDINQACDWATDYAISVGADYFSWDCDGMGVSLRRQVSESLAGKRIDVQEYRGSAGVDRPNQIYQAGHILPGSKPKSNKDTFENKRAQFSWDVRDRVYATYKAVTRGEYKDPADLISFSSDIKYMDKFRSEACRIPLHPRPLRGLIQILSKADMLRLYKIQSPNMFDAVTSNVAIETMTRINRQVIIPSRGTRRMSK
jgi:phage terminase large subunit